MPASSERGVVLWFNNAEGHGRIRSETLGDELYVHFSWIDVQGFKTLREGQSVEFERVTAPGPNGPGPVAMFVVPLT